MLKRNTLRKTSSISSFATATGKQIKPHYEFSTGGEMYNQCFLIVKVKRYTNTANVTSRKTSIGTTPGVANYPDKWDEMTPAKCELVGSQVSQTINFNGMTEPQINTTGEFGIYSGACIRIRGHVSSYFRVREILNQDVDNTADATPAEDWPDENLESINTIEEYHSEDDHTHNVEHPQGNWNTDTSPPNEESSHSETDEEPESE